MTARCRRTIDCCELIPVVLITASFLQVQVSGAHSQVCQHKSSSNARYHDTIDPHSIHVVIQHAVASSFRATQPGISRRTCVWRSSRIGSPGLCLPRTCFSQAQKPRQHIVYRRPSFWGALFPQRGACEATQRPCIDVQQLLVELLAPHQYNCLLAATYSIAPTKTSNWNWQAAWRKPERQLHMTVG